MHFHTEIMPAFRHNEIIWLHRKRTVLLKAKTKNKGCYLLSLHGMWSV